MHTLLAIARLRTVLQVARTALQNAASESISCVLRTRRVGCLMASSLAKCTFPKARVGVVRLRKQLCPLHTCRRSYAEIAAGIVLIPNPKDPHCSVTRQTLRLPIAVPIPLSHLSGSSMYRQV